MTDDLLATLPVAQRLALTYASAQVRPDMLALLALEARFSGIIRQGGEPVIAQIKLAWWRERFAQDREDWPKGEPLLAALSRWSGDTRKLGALVGGWEMLLAEALTGETVDSFAEGRAAAWLALAQGTSSTAPEGEVLLAARQWALADLALHLGSESERALVRDRLTNLGDPQVRLDRPLRPLAVLRGLAMRALERGSEELLDGPGAMLAAMRLGIAGR